MLRIVDLNSSLQQILTYCYISSHIRGTFSESEWGSQFSHVAHGVTRGHMTSHYVGETERPLKKCLAEHKKQSSPFGAHLKSEGHEFDPSDVKILDTDSRWLQRGIKEAYYIATLEPDLKHNQGWHTLSSVYNSIIKSCDCGLPRGSSEEVPQMWDEI